MNPSPLQAGLLSHASNLLFFISGSMFTLLISIFDASRRTAVRLFAGCVVGGIGASVAGAFFDGSKYQIVGAGIAAVVTENMVLGLVKASQQFSDNPLATFGQLWKLVGPNFGLKSGDNA